ncbi:hypothetical protein [Fodinicola feengrottensis]|uniref:hypothetical protein n=1 Tax=Fodinicola feengrottensis TaxID=435914 RepID=UPI0031DC2AA0
MRADDIPGRSYGVRELAGTVAMAAVVGIALAGCAGGSSPGGGSATTPAPMRPTVSPSLPAGLPAVTYARTGGIAGFQDELRITPDGQVIASTRKGADRHGTLTASERAELLAAIPKIPLSGMTSTRTAEIPDGFRYVISVGGRSVRFADPSVPPPVSQAVSILNRIVSRVAA